MAPVDEEDEESAPALGGHAAPRSGSKWGSRGISVSADEGVLESESARQNGFSEQEDGVIDTARDADAKLTNPDELARILDDGDSDDDDVLPSVSPSASGVKNGSEWDA